ncbi:hypothetical protein AR687_04865 [Flavobacteriaceae bacterium CRH]|nr:hypothetical protein AR687_04865 [Flavobacteriaceae bacterium CRH]
MEPSSIFFTKILHVLADKYNMSYSVEELAKLVTSVSNVSKFNDTMAAERENQAKLMDFLMLLNYEGYIFLNSDTDESIITIKGLMKINNTILWN